MKTYWYIHIRYIKLKKEIKKLKKTRGAFQEDLPSFQNTNTASTGDINDIVLSNKSFNSDDKNYI
jgi:hypothetical protein